MERVGRRSALCEAVDDRGDDASNLSSRGCDVICTGKDERGFHECTEQHVRERVDGLASDRSGVHGGLESDLREAEAVGLLEHPPLRPTEHGGRLDESDTTHRGVKADVEERFGTTAQHPHWIGDPIDACLQPSDHHGFDLLEDRLEERRLVGEVVVQGALRRSCGAGELVDRGPDETAVREQLASRVEERRPGLLRLLGLASHAYQWYVYTYGRYATGAQMTGPQAELATSMGPIRYRDEGTGPPLLFFHGVLADGQLWRDVVPRLADRFRCIVPDWPLGSHGSPMRPTADLSPPALADLALEFCDAVGLTRVTLVGNDTGGAVCQLLAAHHPERVERLILTPCDAYDNFPPRAIFWPLQLAAVVPGGLKTLLAAMRLRPLQRAPISFAGLSKRLDSALIDDWLRPARTDPAVRRDLRKVIRGLDRRYTLEAIERLRTFPRPVLIAWSPEARFFTWRYAERLASDLPHAQLERIEDAYTFVALDQPERCAQLMADFLDSPPIHRDATDVGT